MEIPYQKLELTLALWALNAEGVNTKALEEIKKKHEIRGKSEMNRKTAEFHRISVQDLINSPKYQTLCLEFSKDLFREMAKDFAEKLGVTDKQAWAMVAYIMGLIP